MAINYIFNFLLLLIYYINVMYEEECRKKCVDFNFIPVDLNKVNQRHFFNFYRYMPQVDN